MLSKPERCRSPFTALFFSGTFIVKSKPVEPIHQEIQTTWCTVFLIKSILISMESSRALIFDAVTFYLWWNKKASRKDPQNSHPKCFQSREPAAAGFAALFFLLGTTANNRPIAYTAYSHWQLPSRSLTICTSKNCKVWFKDHQTISPEIQAVLYPVADGWRLGLNWFPCSPAKNRCILFPNLSLSLHKALI